MEDFRHARSKSEKLNLGLGLMREGREKAREAVRERESSPIVWWSVACAGDGIWSERVTAERKKKRSHFERESTRPLFFFPAFFCLCSPIKFHAY
jgi:hypothetical protein